MKLHEIERQLRAAGWRLERTGKHRKYVNAEGRHLTVGARIGKDLGPETVNAILRRAEQNGGYRKGGQVVPCE